MKKSRKAKSAPQADAVATYLIQQSKPWLPTPQFPTISDPKKRAFLVAYSICGSAVRAAQAAGVTDRTHRNWVKDPEYAAAFAEAKEAAEAILEQEVRRRAILGTLEPVFHQGRVCGYRLRKSDVLLMFLLKALDPDRYAERHQLAGNLDVRHRGRVEHEATEEGLERLRKLHADLAQEQRAARTLPLGVSPEGPGAGQEPRG